MKKLITTVLIASVALLGCSKAKQAANAKRPINVTIDWVPSPEYYGFFVAKHEHLYDNAGLDVKIYSGAGAPTVAGQLGAGTIYAGTTTSDNVLRQVARGAEFSRAVALLRFNPCVIASLSERPVSTLDSLKGRTLGVNKQSSVYQQFQFLKQKGLVDSRNLTEFPIGYGGAAQLKAGQVDCILAYATNMLIDLRAEGLNVADPIYFSDHGVHIYGQVLVFGGVETLKSNGITADDVDRFVEATKAGFQTGATNPSLAATALLEVQPTLERKKIEMAISEIKRLNETKEAKASELDRWVEDQSITESVRQKTNQLYR